MGDEIVKRLMETKKSMRFDEVDDTEEEDDLDISTDDVDPEDEEDLDTPEEDMEDDSHAPTQGHASHRTPPMMDDSDMEEDDTEEEEPEEPESEEPETPKNEYINPLDNAYAVQYTIGDEVSMTYTNGTNSELSGVIEGYDMEGFYRVQWSTGMTTNGITDIALADFISKKQESVCICGSKKFVNEDKYVVCDTCGRHIRENKTLDALTLADKKRPAGKKMIRSEAHPINTAAKPNISEAIKSALKNR